MYAFNLLPIDSILLFGSSRLEDGDIDPANTHSIVE